MAAAAGPATERSGPAQDGNAATAETAALPALAAWVREELRQHGLARLPPMTEARFLDLAGGVGEVGLRTDMVIDPAQAEEERRRRGTATERPVVYAPTELGFHTDRPTVDVIGWYCVEQDAEDGAVLLIDTADLGEHFGAAEIAGLGRVEVGYFQRDAHTGREETRRAPLVARGPRGHLLYYAPWLVQESGDAETALLVARFAAYVEKKRETALVRIRLQRGEALFVDNRRLLHARGNLSPSSRRHIVRLYIACPAGPAAAGVSGV
jgi:Taurine catabolism dioxygenase TauD, TfdA family